MKKVLFFLMAFALMFQLTAEGQKEDSKAKEDVEIVFWSHLGESPEFVQAFAEKATEAFHSIGLENFSVKAEVVEYSNYEQKYLSAFSSGKGPDIFFGRANNWALEYGINPIAAPFREDTQKVWDEALHPLMAKCSVIDGKRFGIPFEGAVGQMLYYNVDHFKEAGLDPADPPETLEEFADYAKKLTKYDGSGNITQGGYGMRYLGAGGGIWSKYVTTFHQFGAEAISPDGKTATGYINSPEGVASYQFFYDLVFKEKVVNTSFDTPVTSFKQGVVSMIYREPWLISALANDVPDLNYALAPIPGGEDGLIAYNAPLDGWNYMVNSQTEYYDEIMDMLIALCTVEADVYIVEKRSTPPILRESYETDYAKSLPYSHIIEAYANSKETPQYVNLGAPQATAMAGEELVKMIMGEQTAQEAADNAAQRMDEFLGSLE